MWFERLTPAERQQIIAAAAATDKRKREAGGFAARHQPARPEATDDTELQGRTEPGVPDPRPSGLGTSEKE